MEPPAAVEFAEWVHGPQPDHRVHFMLVDGTFPACARDLSPDADGYGIGLADIHKSGRLPCKTCCRRLGTNFQDLNVLIQASNS